MRENREYVRLDSNLRVNWRKIMETTDHIVEFPDVTTNVSAGGLCMIMHERINVGDELKLRMELPSKKFIYAQGIVLWINEFEINKREGKRIYYTGIEFTELHGEFQHALKEFVQTNLPSK